MTNIIIYVIIQEIFIKGFQMKKICLGVSLFFALVINVNGGVIDWTANKIKDKSKDTAKGYASDKYKGYREKTRKKENLEGRKGLISTIEDKKEDVASKVKKGTRNYSDSTFGKDNVDNAIETRNKIVKFKDDTKQKAFDTSINKGKELIGEENTKKIKAISDYKKQKSEDVNRYIEEKSGNFK